VAVVGVLLNPIAGFGGPLAMHGTDRLPASRFDEAIAEGLAERRLLHALTRFQDAAVAAELMAAPGLLGAVQLAAAGIPHRVLTLDVPPQTTRHDTKTAARRMVAEGIDVLLFVGGDGTATDIADAVGTAVPVVGVPAGVKMHSEVFAQSPESAGRLLADFVSGNTSSGLAEVLDIGDDDESGVVGVLLAPRSREALQGAKASRRSIDSDAAARGVARELVAEAGGDVTWVLGPGRTVGAVAEELGFVATLRGVDVRHPSGKVELDLAEDRLNEIAAAAPHPRLVLGVVGGQGFLLGRGNQQLSARVLERIGAERVDIVGSDEKVAALLPPDLYVDAEGTPGLLGYRRVRTGTRRSTVMRVVDARRES
jgi:predicted polyphosphate/ATP-dependent NAD kinase